MGNYCDCDGKQASSKPAQSDVYTVGSQHQAADGVFGLQRAFETSEVLVEEVKSTRFAIPKKTSNEAWVSNLSDFLQIEASLSGNWLKEVDEVVFEGPVLKFKPGLTHMYISRWLQLSTHGLRYYKSQRNANCWFTKPLFSVCLESVRDVERLILTKEQTAKTNKPFQFEIFLKEEDELTCLSRHADGSCEYYQEALQVAFTPKTRDSVEKGRLMKRPIRVESPERQGESRYSLKTSPKLYRESSWSFRELEWYASEKRLLFATDSLNSVKNWVSLIQLALKKRD